MLGWRKRLFQLNLLQIQPDAKWYWLVLRHENMLLLESSKTKGYNKPEVAYRIPRVKTT